MNPFLAASVILLRDGEVYLVRRHAKSSFLKLAFVFPGGGADDHDGGLEGTAIRELFEETGVLLCDQTPPADRLERLRTAIASDSARWIELLAAEGLGPDSSKLRFWARWITPSVEPRRFDATFFVAQLPSGQTPRIDGREVIDDRWLTPAAALAAHEAGELVLPPPQIRMLFELEASMKTATWDTTIAGRLDTTARILPRFALTGAEQRPSLLLPWDPEYATAGTGESYSLEAGHPWAWGPSRFLREGETWRLRDALPYFPAQPPKA